MYWQSFHANRNLDKVCGEGWRSAFALTNPLPQEREPEWLPFSCGRRVWGMRVFSSIAMLFLK
jgi:hypothetical protein